MIRTELTPNEIIGWENIPIFIAHLQICKSTTNSGEFPVTRLNKEVGAANRDRIVKIYEELRANGFYPLYVHNGKICWGVVTKSESLKLFDNHELEALRRLPLEKLMQIGRAGYVRIVKSVKVERAEDHELNREEVCG